LFLRGFVFYLKPLVPKSVPKAKILNLAVV